MEKDGIIEITLHGISNDGSAVGRTADGMTVFVSGALPGQTARARVTRVKKRLAFAECLETVTPAPGERPAPCPHAGACGGCPWQRMEYADQLSWKRRIVLDAMNHIGRLGLPDEAVAPVRFTADEEHREFRCRSKMEFAFGSGPGGLVLGLRGRDSHKVASITGCLLQTPHTMEVLQEVRRLCIREGLEAAPAPGPARGGKAPSLPRDGNGSARILRHAVIREPAAGGCLVELITLPGHADALRRIGMELTRPSGPATGFVHSIRTAASSVAYGERTAFTAGDAGLAETLRLQGRDVTFRLDHNSFFQVNTRAAELLYNTAAELAAGLFGRSAEPSGAAPCEAERRFTSPSEEASDAAGMMPQAAPGDRSGSAAADRPAPASHSGALWGTSCWDIYCGVGGLALTMAPHFRSVSGMEVVPQAVELARRNAASSGSSADFTFEAGDAAALERWFSSKGVPDLLVTDPPRAGMDAKTTAAILRHRPPRIVLVSCDPCTLARDLAELSAAYEINGIVPVDLFPQTSHIETVAALRLRRQ
ncbi:MAG: class I SAM-dependent RNA methyltransferase [Mailhella sp.]|nr:class I SAM-dependent RNA methyltransferase [Mailhella sp.]